MKVTFLGTGTSQGVPIIGCTCAVCQSTNRKDKRLRCSILIEVDNVSIVVDTGPDFRQQMLTSNNNKLDAVLFTHSHMDHTAGLDDVRAYNFIHQKPMEVFADDLTIATLKNQYAYIFAKKKYPGIPQINLNTITNQPFSVKDIGVIPIEVMHHKLPVKGFRINDFTYITDANYISPQEKEKIKGSKILVLNALRQTEHISHFTLQQAIELSQEFKVEKTYLTHISHQMGLHNEVTAELPNNIHLAYDQLTINC